MNKRNVLIGMIIFALVFTVVGCSTSNNVQQGKESNKVQVFTSFYVLSDFAKKIGGDYVEVKNMIPAGTEPHDFEPTPKEIAQLQKADLFVYNGSGFDQWAKTIVDNNKGKITVVNSSTGVSILGSDPHIWLNPMNAEIQAANIRDGLIKVDPIHKDIYNKNFEQLKQSFSKLDETYQSELKKATSREIFVSHAAFGYLAERYQLKQISIAGLTPEDEPSPKEIASIVTKARQDQVKYILFEPLIESKYGTTIMNEIGAKALILNPVESLTKDELVKGEDYFSVMNKNLEVLKTVLGVK
ncbi:metal ABC transporter solute-binding protein, Zn/Mn family [Tepidibacillus marianensis]|uniref:metal ABC transporter solute-binding protein, Zn/Mn family n=1 Tax=Tepidibacillus marianensis TaxID=3131995 RepID=UPI0030D297F8